MTTSPRAMAGRRPRVPSGFTMVEMLIVVALIGIVATLALPNFRNATRKAREAVLREDLWTMRDVIDQYHTDRGKYPTSLEDLKEAGYLRAIPIDPITGSNDTWQTITEPIGTDVPEEEEVDPGITDVSSGAPGVGLDGTAYSTW